MSNENQEQRTIPIPVFTPAQLEIAPDEERTAEIRDFATQKVIFRQEGCLFPSNFSDTAVNVIASKYFYGDNSQYDPKQRVLPGPGTGREWSFSQLAERVCTAIAAAARKQGLLDDNGFDFNTSLTTLCTSQTMAFNSPVWFNVGLSESYGIKGNAENWIWSDREQTAVPCPDTYQHPQASACFIQSVEDTMPSILELARSEAMLFKGGSGTGSDLSTLRSTYEKLSGGGKPSGPVSFLKLYDTIGGLIKSGGKCMAPYQPVFTAGGIKPARELAESGKDFAVLSYSRRLGRMTVKAARAWKSGEKPVVAVVTDKGEFHVSADHPFLLKTGEVVRAIDLKAGLRLFAVSTSRHSAGYVQVGLHDGKKGKGLLHRMVADALVKKLVASDVVHHGPRGILDSNPDNLTILPGQSEHAGLHGREAAEKGEHIFQRERFPKAGEANGMHRSSEFWQSDRATEYRQTQSALMVKSGRAGVMQKAARRVAMLNTGYKLINAGHDISTLDGYIAARKAAGNRVGVGRERQEAYFVKHFGSYADFYTELERGNHRVVEVRPIGTMPVYSIEVDDDESDDKRAWSEHNYVIAPLGTTEPFMNGVAVLNTRRAARMQTLKTSHPNIKEFIEAKPSEEQKARALSAAGYGTTMDSESYTTVAFQNTNLSVRASDAFLRAVEAGESWQTVGVHPSTDAARMPCYKAGELMDGIATGTWICGDPGIQYDDTIQRWHTCSNTAPINSSNPCSEYLFIDDSACNLASINLLKFLRSDGTFDYASFADACAVTVTAQETLVDYASYPTAKIAVNSHWFRPLGLGYANLGGLLMAMGLPYDSDAGRLLAGVITSILSASGYCQSASIARKVGPFPGFAENRQPMMNVMRQHAAASRELVLAVLARKETPSNLAEMARFASDLWDEAIDLGQQWGFRNSQISVLAPTGTIGFMMDCTTTGVEPAVALVAYKSLAGGGHLKLVNPLVRRALESLGYDESAIQAIETYINAHDTIEGCPELHPDSLPVFDCAFPPPQGGRSIAFRGHILMMAAVQPFISGAISKTCNVPRETTPEQIRDIYLEGWKLGLKALAIYRDGSKGGQPLSTKKSDDPAVTDDAATVDLGQQLGLRYGERRKLPNEVDSRRFKFRIGEHSGYFHVGRYDDADQSVGELFIKMAKQGSTIGGLMDALGAAISIGLQHGVPLAAYVKRLGHMRFEPSGFTGDRDVPIAKSIVDFIFRKIAFKFIPGYSEAFSPTALDEDLAPRPSPTPVPPDAVIRSAIQTASIADAPLCANCGAIMIRRTGPCYTCDSCGTPSGGCG